MFEVELIKATLSDKGASWLPRPFELTLNWLQDGCVPCVGDTVRLRQSGPAGFRQLKVKRIIHRVNVASKTHTLDVQVYHATPQPVFGSFEECFDETLEMLPDREKRKKSKARQSHRRSPPDGNERGAAI